MSREPVYLYVFVAVREGYDGDTLFLVLMVWSQTLHVVIHTVNGVPLLD